MIFRFGLKALYYLTTAIAVVLACCILNIRAFQHSKGRHPADIAVTFEYYMSMWLIAATVAAALAIFPDKELRLISFGFVIIALISVLVNYLLPFGLL